MISPSYLSRKKEKSGGIAEFVRQRRQMLSSLCRGNSDADAMRLFASADIALKSLKKEKKLVCRDGKIRLYEIALECISEGAVSDAELRRRLSLCGELFTSAELSHLEDFLYVAAVQRIYETHFSGADGKEARARLLSDADKIRTVDFSGTFFEFCAAVRIFERDVVFPLCSEKTKLLYLHLLGKYADAHSLDEREAAERVLLYAEKHGKTVDSVLFEYRKSHAAAYYASLAAVTACMAAIFASAVGGLPALLLLLPVTVTLYDLSKQILAGIFTRLGDGYLPRLAKGDELDGTRCLITVAAILRGEKTDGELFCRLEDFYLRNKSKNYIFSVLGDLGESDTAERDSDAEVISYAERRISALNEKYGGGFALFIRGREFCECQGKYLSRERKRGGIEELCRFLTGEKTEYKSLIFDEKLTGKINYLLTLDFDTELSFGAVRELLGIMLHPQNKAEVDEEKGRVVRGCGIIQPAVACRLSSAGKTPFSAITCGDGGVDVYSGTGRELYQSVTGHGNFCGKGMIDIKTYLAVCGGVFPRQRILSHDLPEGILLRCGTACDVVLCDSTPSGAISYYARLNRWMRGDLQSLIFLPKTIENARGKTIKNPVDTEGKYRIADNILRHGSPLCAVFALFLSCLFGARTVALTAIFSLAFVYFGVISFIYRLWRFGKTGGTMPLGFAAYLLSSLAYHAQCFADAAVRTVWRFAVTGRNFLDWTSAAQAENSGGGILSYYKRMIISVTAGVGALFVPYPVIKLMGILWVIFPALAFLLSSKTSGNVAAGKRGRGLFLESARRGWQFFEDFVCERTNYLPPDNYQFSPEERLAERTSPTNIGMYLVSVLCARDLGFITSDELSRRARKCGEALLKMLTWHGHFYNWYDTGTLEVIGEPFISSVDSGNFAVSVVTLCEGMKDYACECTALLDVINMYEQILAGMDFSALYDGVRRLFYIGYNVKTGKYSEGHYDIFASEARLLGYFAVCTGQVPAESYYAPARRLCGEGDNVGLLSWSGTAFEYFLPALFLPTEKRSVTEKGLMYAYAAQRRAAVKKAIAGRRISLFGVSESQYFGFDTRMNYQYKAFGISDVSLDPVFSGDEVISPYSSFLMYFCGAGVISNLKTLKRIGAYGKYGYCEAVDFCRGRVGDGYAVIKSYMAHHTGMIIASCTNALSDGVLIKRFMRDPRMHAGGLLLEERAAKGAIPEMKKEKRRPPEKHPVPTDEALSDTVFEKSLTSPDVYMLSNNKTRLVASSSGHTFMYDGERCIFASGRDVFSLRGGMTVTAEVDGGIISAVPLGYTGGEFSSEFSVRYDEKSIVYFSRHVRRGKTVEFTVTLKISPEYPCLYVSAALSGSKKSARIMIYLEPIMQEEEAYLSHKSFSELFLQSELLRDENTLLISRRPRGEGSTAYLGITERTGAEVSFGTGRGDLPPSYSGKDVAELIFSPCNEKETDSLTSACRVVAESSRAEFVLGCSKNKDDLVYYLKKDGGRFSTDALRQLQHGAAQIGKNAADLESWLLRAAFFPKADRHDFDKATMARLLRHPIDKSAFYRFSLSGDYPVVCIRFTRGGSISADNVRSFLALFRYACIRGFRYDTVIIYSESDVYSASVRKYLEKLVRDAGCENFLSVPCGIYLINENRLTEGEEYALCRMASAVADASLPLSVTIKSNKYYLPLSRETEKRIAEGFVTDILPCDAPKTYVIEKTYCGVFYDGGFLADKKKLRAPFANVCSSKALGFVSTQNSLGFTFAANSGLCKLTPHDADSLCEDSGERLILRVLGQGEDEARDFDMCACSAYFDVQNGRSVYYGAAEGIEYRVEVFADGKLAAKYVEVFLDTAKVRKKAEIIFSVRTCLGQRGDNMRRHITVADDEMTAVKIYSAVRGDAKINAAILCDGEGEIITDGAALRTGGAIFCGTDDIAAIKHPAKNGRNSFALIAFRGEEDFDFIKQRFIFGYRSCAGEKLLPDVTVNTGDPLFDSFVNGMAYRQCVACRMIARAGFYQVGGAYGFRDQLQDSLSLSAAELKRQMIFCLCHQYEEGDVMHWWHNIYSEKRGHRGIRTRCSDDCAWLVYAFLEYIERTGDTAFAWEKYPFVSSPPLDENERERYEQARFTDEKFTVREHIRRAAGRLFATGSHGLSLIGGCDWNDGMNGVGSGGRGESVWLSQFSSDILSRLARFCRESGEKSDAEKFSAKAKELKTAVEKYGFDDDRYIRGFYDSGAPLGARSCDECKIDVLPQAFAVFSGCDAARSRKATDTAVRELFDAELGIFRLLVPPFDKTEQKPGYIKGYIPGTRENGGQYTHAAIWGAMALILSGREDRGTKILLALCPALRSRARSLAEKYMIEPYVLAGDVHSVGEDAGRGGWSWYTGAAGWYRTAVVSCVCGYHEKDGGFYLSPHLSDVVSKVSLSVERRGTKYEIKITKAGRPSLILDGDELLSDGKSAEDIVFFFSGGEHKIIMTL